MDPAALFQLAVRLLGLAFLYHGLLGVPSHAGALLTTLMARAPLNVVPILGSCLWPLLLGVWFVRGGPGFLQAGGRTSGSSSAVGHR